MGKKLVFSVLCLASIAAFIAKADTLTLQQGLNDFSGFSDTYIVMTTDSTPNLSSELIVEGYHCSACIDERALMRIDLGSLDKNVTISKAELQLFSPSQPRPGSGIVQVYKISIPWADSEANWFNSEKSTKWSNAGGDFIATSVTKLQYGTQTNVWHKFDITSAVRDFAANPASNFGVMLKLDPSMLTVTYVSSQGSQEKRPKLVITYSTTAGVAFSSLKQRSSAPLKVEQIGSGINFAFSDNGSHRIRLDRLNGEVVFDKWINGNSFVLGISGLAKGPYLAQAFGNQEELNKEIILTK
jgi:hypothetical protein